MIANIEQIDRAETLNSYKLNLEDRLRRAVKEAGLNRPEHAGTDSALVDNEIRDGFALSRELRPLLNSGVDVNNSSASVSTSEFSFDLQFKHDKVEQLAGNGYFVNETNELDLSMSYRFQQAVARDGVSTMHTYEVDFSLKLKNTASVSATLFEEKEDIGGFITRFTKDIIDIVADDDRMLAGVVFDLEDLSEINAMDNGKFLKMINDLIAAISVLDFTQKVAGRDEKADKVTLYPKRRKFSGIDIDVSNSEMVEFKLEIRDITATIQNRAQEAKPAYSEAQNV